MSHITQEFLWKGTKITITAPTIQTGESKLVRTGEFRPFLSLSDPDVSDWTLDTQYLLDQLASTACTLNDYKQALTNLCVKHINQYGRLIDTDLYSYVDEIVLIMKCIFELEYGSLSKDHGRMAWEGMKQTMFENLSAYIYLNVPTASIVNPSRLVSLEQYQSGDY